MRLTRYAGLFIVLSAGVLLFAQRATDPVDWPYYGGDQAATKYSPLTDINAGNLQRLQVAWQWKHWDTPPAPGRAWEYFCARAGVDAL